MKNILFLVLFSMLGFFSYTEYHAYKNRDSENVLLVKDYIYNMEFRNYDAVKAIILDSDHINKIRYLLVDFNNYKITGETESRIHVSFERFCYENPEVTFYLENGKIDSKKTMRNIISTLKNNKKTRDYCYDFKEQKLTGLLESEEVHFLQAHKKTKDYGNGNIERKTFLFFEKCDYENFSDCHTPFLDISELEISGNGGNFNSNNFVKISSVFNEKGIKITEGSYKIIDDYNQYKIYLSFHRNNVNHLNGYFFMKKPSIDVNKNDN